MCDIFRETLETPKKFQVDRNWQIQFKLFKKKFQHFRDFVLNYRANSKRGEKRQN